MQQKKVETKGIRLSVRISSHDFNFRIKQAIKFLENEYMWSSYFDYIGKQNFLSVTEREFMLNVMGGADSCKKSVDDWVKFNSHKE